MGCNASKSEDIAKSQQQRTRQQQPQASKSPATRPMGIDAEKPVNKTEDDKQPMSYTDRREIEVDYLKRIIDSTVLSLIDVSSTIAPLEGSDVRDRARDYGKQVKDSKSGIDITFTSPPRSHTKDPVSVLTTRIESVDVDFVTQSSVSACIAINEGMKVKDCGPIVVPFGEFTDKLPSM